tara:strand:- start:1714 stop:1911 length:198 start_codon:yes stop_codon:yes gene_type:complete
MSNISEFERNKPRKTFREIDFCIKKYKNIVAKTIIECDEDCLQIEMANDFVKELEKIKKVFLTGK